MKLVKTMFVDDEPKYIANFYGKSINTEWKEWKRRQVRPDDHSCCNVFCADFQGNAIRYQGKCYEQALEYYNQHRLRYKSEKLDEGTFQLTDKLVIQFCEDNLIELEYNGESIYFGKGTVQLFELICSENGIELDTIK